MPPPRGVAQRAAAVEGRLLGTAAPATAALSPRPQHSPHQLPRLIPQMQIPPVAPAAAAAAVRMMVKTALAADGLLVRAGWSRRLLPRVPMDSLPLHKPRSRPLMSQLQGPPPSRKRCPSIRPGPAQGLRLPAQELLDRRTAPGTLAARAAPQRGMRARMRTLAAMRGRGPLHSPQQLQRCLWAVQLPEPAGLPAALLLLVRGRRDSLERGRRQPLWGLLTQGMSAAARTRAAGRRLPWACTLRGTMRCTHVCYWHLQCGLGSASHCDELHVHQSSAWQITLPSCVSSSHSKAVRSTGEAQPSPVQLSALG